MRARSLLPRAAALLVTVVLFVAVAQRAPAAAVAPALAVDSPPQLLLIHGGSFLFEQASFRAETEAAATAAGFVPHYLDYPLDDLPGAYRAARAAVLQMRRSFGPGVYAYGTSAGGTLAALLAGDGLVVAAAAKAPPSDLLGWQWPIAAYGAGYYESIRADPGARRRLSPLRRPARRPLLVVQGRGDRVVPLTMSETFAAKFRRVHLWPVPGGHWTERRRPWVLQRALGWLGRIAERQRR